MILNILCKRKPVMTSRLTAYQNCGLVILFLKSLSPKIERIKSLDIILKNKNSFCDLASSIIKSPRIVRLTSNIYSNNYCCICLLLVQSSHSVYNSFGTSCVLIVLFTSAKMQLNHTLRFFFIQLALLMNYRNAPKIYIQN